MKAFFRKPNNPDHEVKRFALGTSSAAVLSENLGQEIKTSIQLAFYLFGKLDRKIIAAMEISFNLNASHRRNIRRYIGEISNRPVNLKEIVKPHIGAPHHLRYRIFGDLCKIASGHQCYEMAYIRKIILIGQSLTLTEDEIFRLIKQSGLAE